MDYSEEEIVEMFTEAGGEDFVKLFEDYTQKREKLVEEQKQELEKKQLPIFTKYNTALISNSLRILDLEFGFQLLMLLLSKSTTITPEVQKGLDIINKNKQFYT